MKKIASLVFFLLFWGSSVSHAQPIYVSSYDDTAQKVFFCHGVRQNTLGLDLLIANLNPTSSFYLDSVVYFCDTNSFKLAYTRDSVQAGGLVLLGGPMYAPETAGRIDTLTIRAFYGNTFSEGKVICYSVESPDLGLYGVSTSYFNLFPGNGLGSDNIMITTDTLHDIFSSAFAANGIASDPGFNRAVRLRSCGGATIDSIYEVGDFSELQLPTLPKVPVTIGAEDSVVIPYYFTPSVVGNTHHYLVFHSTTGQYLVWSFEYQVVPVQSVATMQTSTSGVRLFPNPARSIVHIEPANPQDRITDIEIINILGQSLYHANLGSGADALSRFSIESLPNGMYDLIAKMGKSVSVQKLCIAK